MDGAPVRGDHTPLRFYLADQPIWPFKKFPGAALEVDFYLRVMMVDENDKAYFKRMPIEFGRYLPSE